MTLIRAITLLNLLLLPLFLQAAESVEALNNAAKNTFVGNAVCGECHTQQAASWQQSDHFQAMRPADEASVLGRFDTTLQANDQSYRLFRRDGQYLVEMPMQHGQDNVVVPIKYTFGHSPLQQYLVEMPGGRMQALNTAWDARSEADGGQRWFHLRDEMSADSPFHFSRSLQNWNAGCAACHSTGLVKGYDNLEDRYDTTYAEPNVGCESCHGPGSAHVSVAQAGKPPPPLIPVPKSGQWRFEAEAAIAHLSSPRDTQFIDTCGGCHARRAQIAPLSNDGTFLTQFELSRIDSPLYYPDGQIRDEVFVLGSFMQSKMYQKGVTCGDCHDPHSGGLKRQGNQLCAGCHNPSVFESSDHLRHVKASTGAQCVNCHMPETVYMGVDARRDHHFGLPDPALTIAQGIPNACNQCHEDKSAKWALDNMGQRPITNQFTLLQLATATRDPLLAPKAVAYILDDSHPAIRRATILAQLPFNETTLRIAVDALQSKNDSLDATLIRSAAVAMIGNAPISVRQWLLNEHLSDPSLAVRLAVTRALLDGVASNVQHSKMLLTAIAEYRESLIVAQDQASGQAALATLALALGQFDQARQHLERALQIEPHFLPARLNLADLHRSRGREALALEALKQAVSIAPDSGAAQHSLGLALVRQGDTSGAIERFTLAIQQDDHQPEYHYVYAVALDSVARTDDAVRALVAASKLWPNQYNLLVLEVVYREKTGLLVGIKQPIRQLAKLAPSDANVQRWVAKHRVHPTNTSPR